MSGGKTVVSFARLTASTDEKLINVKKNTVFLSSCLIIFMCAVHINFTCLDERREKNRLAHEIKIITINYFKVCSGIV